MQKKKSQKIYADGMIAKDLYVMICEGGIQR